MTAAVLAHSDAELLQRANAGERDALEELFVRHRSLAYRVAYRLLGHEEDALDAVQEAFVKAITHLPTFEGRSSFKTWLLRVVSNAALDLGRQRGRRETMSMDAFGQRRREEMEPSVTVEPDRELQREDLRRELQQALDCLPPAQRQTFVLHVDAELSYREVADALGISIGTVMSRLFYARQKLRAILASWTRR
jgi:RNA polymerase sigma-70 factor (ECF subfamily)